MIEPRGHDVTLLLEQLQEGRTDAEELLLPLVYDELRGLARLYMSRERENHTLQPTALVHEAWMRLANQREVNWRNRAHFLGIAAQAMRRILVDHARRRHADKRGGGRDTTLDGNLLSGDQGADPVDIVALDQALDGLGAMDPRALRVVELRYFGGLALDETAEVLGISIATVKRDWRDARVWLRRELSQIGRGASPEREPGQESGGGTAPEARPEAWRRKHG